MGFFSKLFSTTPVQLTISNEREAYASILLACMVTDGNISEEEQTTFVSLLYGKAFFDGYDVTDMYIRASNNFNKCGGSSALIDACAAAITPGRRLNLFTNCVDIILSDGQVSASEEEVLDYLKGKFDVNDTFAQQAVTVLIEKNK